MKANQAEQDGMLTRYIAMILAVLATSGCSNKAVYDNLQLNERNECMRTPGAQPIECIERTDKSFEEYEQERKEYLREREREIDEG